MQLPRLGLHPNSVAFGIYQQLVACCLLIAAIFVAGTLGFVLIEGWSFRDAFYMTSITMSTVGYSETRELTALGRLFTSGLIFFSLVGMACWTASITSAFVSRELSGTFARNRIKKMIKSMQQHTIIFGAGVMAETIMQRMLSSEQGIVLVENDPDKVDDFQRRYPEVLVLESPPKNELVLIDANLAQARNVVVMMESDFDNLLVAMSVKEFDPRVRVIARANDPLVASRLWKVGVDKVICPYQLSGEYVADWLTTATESGCEEAGTMAPVGGLSDV